MGREVTLLRLQGDLRRRILDLRAIEGIVDSHRFRRLWDASDEDLKTQALKHIDKVDKLSLKDWMAYHPDIILDEMSFNQLRRIGQKLGVSNYCRLDRNRLIKAIEDANGKKNTDRSSEDPVPQNE